MLLFSSWIPRGGFLLCLSYVRVSCLLVHCGNSNGLISNFLWKTSNKSTVMPQCSALGIDPLWGPEWMAGLKNSNFCPQWRSHTLALGGSWYRPCVIGHFMCQRTGMLTCVFFSSCFSHVTLQAHSSDPQMGKKKPSRILANFLF